MKNKLLSIVLLLLVLTIICPACIITQNTTTGVTSSTTSVTTTRSTSTHLVSTTSVTKTKSTSTPPVSTTDASLVISTQHLGDGIMNSNYNFALSAAGGVPPYAWSIESGNLPDGLKLDTSTGTINGIPAKSGGPTTLFFKVTDGSGAFKIRGLSVSIKLGDFQ